MKTVAEAMVTKAAEEATTVKVAEEAMTKTTAEEAMVATVATDTVTVAGSTALATVVLVQCEWTPGGLSTRCQTRRWQVRGLPPRQGRAAPTPSQAVSRRQVVCHAFIAEFSFFLPTLRPCFMILACMFQGDEPGHGTGIPGL
jgi:hypothetical protein